MPTEGYKKKCAKGINIFQNIIFSDNKKKASEDNGGYKDNDWEYYLYFCYLFK